MTRFDIQRSYDWNYENAPKGIPADIHVAAFDGNWDFCGLPVASPLGMPAGPLLNSAWILYYAKLGFDVLTYKTVRSRYRKSFDAPNLLPVDAPQLTGTADAVTQGPGRSWAISFGMPSKDPAVWRKDVEAARRGLRGDQVLVVSVVASPEKDWDLGDITDDFVQCANWAKDAGAQAVEANLSCPNVCSQEGQLYHSPRASREISAAMADALGGVPLVLKIGLFDDAERAAAFVSAVGRYATALSTVNSISATVRTDRGDPAFAGSSRGIGGECVRDRCQAELAMLASVARAEAPGLRLIGVGGVSTAEDVRRRLSAGAHHVQVATAAMLDPLVAVRIRKEIAMMDSLLLERPYQAPASTGNSR